MAVQPDDTLIVVRPTPDAGRHPERRLARMLKALKRAYGYRCVTVRRAAYGLPATEPALTAKTWGKAE